MRAQNTTLQTNQGQQVKHTMKETRRHRHFWGKRGIDKGMHKKEGKTRRSNYKYDLGYLQSMRRGGRRKEQTPTDWAIRYKGSGINDQETNGPAWCPPPPSTDKRITFK